MPFLDLFFARDCCHGIVITFKPDKQVHIISGSKSTYEICLVFVDSSNEIVRQAEIERPVLAAGEQIDIKHTEHTAIMDSGLAASPAPRNDELRKTPGFPSARGRARARGCRACLR